MTIISLKIITIVKVIELDLAKDSWMILACDGIWNSMSSEEVVEYVNKKINDVPDDKLSTICEEVYCYAFARCHDRYCLVRVPILCLTRDEKIGILL